MVTITFLGSRDTDGVPTDGPQVSRAFPFQNGGGGFLRGARGASGALPKKAIFVVIHYRLISAHYYNYYYHFKTALFLI